MEVKTPPEILIVENNFESNGAELAGYLGIPDTKTLDAGRPNRQDFEKVAEGEKCRLFDLGEETHIVVTNASTSTTPSNRSSRTWQCPCPKTSQVTAAATSLGSWRWNRSSRIERCSKKPSCRMPSSFTTTTFLRIGIGLTASFDTTIRSPDAENSNGTIKGTLNPKQSKQARRNDLRIE